MTAMNRLYSLYLERISLSSLEISERGLFSMPSKKTKYMQKDIAVRDRTGV